jgi:hypothetical protein
MFYKVHLNYTRPLGEPFVNWQAAFVLGFPARQARRLIRARLQSVAPGFNFHHRIRPELADQNCEGVGSANPANKLRTGINSGKV